MVDYNAALPQLAQFQAPNVLAMARQANQMQAANMLMQQRTRELDKETALNAAAREYGVNTPEFARVAGGLDYEAGLKASHYQSQIENQKRQAAGEARRTEVSTAELAAKHAERYRNLLPSVNDQPAWTAWRTEMLKDLKGAADVIPELYSPEAKTAAAMTASEFIQSIRDKDNKVVVDPVLGALEVMGKGGNYTSKKIPVIAPGAAPPAAAMLGTTPSAAALAIAAPGAAAGAPAGFDMARAKMASANIESGGKYDALGPITKNGDRAYGKYQVMGNNIPSWTKEVFGKSMTPEDFLADPTAQEKVYEQQFGKNVAKYGNVADAASVWFTGKPLAQAGNVSDVLGTTAPEYVSKFMAGYGGAGGGGGAAPRMMTAPQFAVPGSVPGYVQPANALAPLAAVEAANNLRPKQIPMMIAGQGGLTKFDEPQTRNEAEYQKSVRDVEVAAATEKAKKEVGAQFKAGEEVPKYDDLMRQLNDVIKPNGLLDRATGSDIGAGLDRLGRVVGVSTKGARASAALAPLAGALTAIVPRFEGPQSEGDRKSYETQAGILADKNETAETRRAAAKAVLEIMKRNRNANAAKIGAEPIAEPPRADAFTLSPENEAIFNKYRVK
jgi:hypothetical protein